MLNYHGLVRPFYWHELQFGEFIKGRNCKTFYQTVLMLNYHGLVRPFYWHVLQFGDVIKRRNGKTCYQTVLILNYDGKYQWVGVSMLIETLSSEETVKRVTRRFWYGVCGEGFHGEALVVAAGVREIGRNHGTRVHFSLLDHCRPETTRNKFGIFRLTVQIAPNFFHWNAHIFLFWLNPRGHSDSGQTARTPLYPPVQVVPAYSLPPLSSCPDRGTGEGQYLCSWRACATTACSECSR